MVTDLGVLGLDEASAWRAVDGRDPRFDGRLFLGVATTGIYCRPSCPARTPRPENCRWFLSAHAAVTAGFRACRRCRPGALSQAAENRTLVAEALRLIAGGVVDDVGVDGLAERLAVSTRHLHRLLVAEVGATVLQLARARRAQTARTLLVQTTLPVTDIAFAAGFASVRQFNDVMRAEVGLTPSQIRSGVDGPESDRRESATSAMSLSIRLPAREPYAADPVRRHLADRAVPGLERMTGPATLTRLVRVGREAAVVTVDFAGATPRAQVQLAGVGNLADLLVRLRAWLDLDADPAQIDATLRTDRKFAALVAATPGLRVVGTVDGFELAERAVLGQQVSTAAARTLTARLVERWGDDGPGGLSLFPSPDRLAAVGPDAIRGIGLTRGKALTVHGLAVATSEGLDLSRSADPVAARAALLALPGVGAWTADYIALRAFGDPDVFPGGDLVLRKQLGLSTAAEAEARVAHLRPWRSYAAQHLWYTAAIGSGKEKS